MTVTKVSKSEDGIEVKKKKVSQGDPFLLSKSLAEITRYGNERRTKMNPAGKVSKRNEMLATANALVESLQKKVH